MPGPDAGGFLGEVRGLPGRHVPLTTHDDRRLRLLQEVGGDQSVR